MKNPFVFIGAGGHAKVVLDVALANGSDVLAVYDDNAGLTGEALLGIIVRGLVETLSSDDTLRAQCQLIVAIGDNFVRRELQQQFKEQGWRFGSVIHQRSNISSRARIGEGSVVMPGANVNVDTQVGVGAILNTGTNVDHENLIGDFVHIGPGATLCGNVEVHDDAFIGAGATILQGLSVGAGSRVGAGAVVVKDVPANTTVIGVPAH